MATINGIRPKTAARPARMSEGNALHPPEPGRCDEWLGHDTERRLEMSAFEIFADEIDAKVAARVFNRAYLSGARSAVVERDPRGWVVRVYQYAPVGYLAPKTEAAA